MKVLLVNGSPRKNGCTHRALEEIAQELEKQNIASEIFWIGTKNQGCIACNHCKEYGECVFHDEVNLFAKMAENADGFIFGTPVYYGSATGGISSFMDRLFYSSVRYMEDKPVATVVSCRRGGATETFAQLNMYYMMNNMPVISSQYWNQVHGFTPQDVEKDIEGLQTMRSLAKNMAWILYSIDAGKKQGLEKPKREKKIPTNFIH